MTRKTRRATLWKNRRARILDSRQVQPLSVHLPHEGHTAACAKAGCRAALCKAGRLAGGCPSCVSGGVNRMAPDSKLGKHWPGVGLLLLCGAAVIVLSGCTVWRLADSLELVRRSEPLQQHPVGAKLRLLIVGDSTAVGTGATSSMSSLAGLMPAATLSYGLRTGPETAPNLQT